jgi:hypothetical protein
MSAYARTYFAFLFLESDITGERLGDLMIIDLWIDINTIGTALSWIVGVIIIVGSAMILGVLGSVVDEKILPWVGAIGGLGIGSYAFFSWKSSLEWFFSGLTSLAFSAIEIVVVAFITYIILHIVSAFKDE